MEESEWKKVVGFSTDEPGALENAWYYLDKECKVEKTFGDPFSIQVRLCTYKGTKFVSIQSYDMLSLSANKKDAKKLNSELTKEEIHLLPDDHFTD